MHRSTVLRRKRRGRVFNIVPVVVLLLGLLIVNQSTVIDYFSAERNYEETAEVMANFIVSEYERQKAVKEDVNLEKIVEMAKKLDGYHGLTVSFSDDSFSIFKELDGSKPIKYNTVNLD